MASLPGLTRPKYPKPEPDVVYRCIVAYISPDGPMPAGERRRGNDPALNRPGAMKLWIRDDLIEHEERAIRNERFPESVGLGR